MITSILTVLVYGEGWVYVVALVLNVRHWKRPKPRRNRKDAMVSWYYDIIISIDWNFDINRS